MEKKQKNIKKKMAAIIFSMLVVILPNILSGMPIYANGNSGTIIMTTEDISAELSLQSMEGAVNVPFQVGNMLPGDSVTRMYSVEVSYQDTVTVHFYADIHDGCEKLAEVLKCKVVLLNTEAVLYEGLMKDMPVSVDHTMSGSSNASEEELLYEITAWLDTSVGNEYQGLSLTADFEWWMEAADKPEAPPESGDSTGTLSGTEENTAAGSGTGASTGDTSNLPVWCVITFGITVTGFLCLKKRKEGEDE